jgi:RNA polymerase sigma-70 factor (ECF subfamily)
MGDGMPTTDLAIEALDGLRAHPDAAAVDHFWKLLERFRAGLVHQALTIVDKQQDAEDIAQETLCKAFLDIHRLRETQKLGIWLREINRCTALAWRRSSRRTKEERLSTEKFQAIEAPHAPQKSGPDDAIVLRAVDSLPEPYRDVVVLRYWEKMSTDDIAAKLNIPAGTVRSRLTRADGILAQKLLTLLKQESSHV